MTELCYLGEYCRTRHPKTHEPGPAQVRGLCLPCEQHGQYAIGQLPINYARLSVQLGVSGATLGGGIPSHRVEPPIPLRPEVDALMRELVNELRGWEHHVRRVARLSFVVGAVRDGFLVDRAAQILVAHYSVLLAMKDPYGLDGVVMLTNLFHRSLSMAGETRVWEWRQLPCPSEPLSDGCGKNTLGQWVGRSDTIECTNCQWRCTIEQYTKYAMTFIPPRKRTT